MACALRASHAWARRLGAASSQLRERQSQWQRGDIPPFAVHLAAGALSAALATALLASGSSEASRRSYRSLRCEALNSSSIIVLDVQSDRPGLLSEATDLLSKQNLDIREAKISTEPGTGKAKHIYQVQDKVTCAGLTPARLEEVRLALEGLGAGSCTAKPWPLYTQDEVAQHTTAENGIWVSYKNGVYDITDFVRNHPGGKDKILLAAGKSIDPFWRIYQQHEGRGTALSQLAAMKIGDLADPPPPMTGSDPYDEDPKRHPGLIFHNNKPCNAELPPEMMLDSWLTPNEVWFIRHHHPVPVLDPSQYHLVVEGVGAKRVTLTLEDIKSRFLKREVVSTIQCGGNRRSELDIVSKTSGIPWGCGAISTARWGGVYLREVLHHCAGLSLEGVEAHQIKHVVFHGIDDMQASIPIEKALSPWGDVLLAYEMNGQDLPKEHGAPVRLIVPGVVGVRNVKWVGRIVTSLEEAEGPWQRGLAYKGFSPMVRDCKEIDVEKILSMQEMPVQSVIVSPKQGSTVELDDIEVKGFAWSGGGRGIVRVDVSIDGGVTWVTAELKQGSEQNPIRAWAWTFWEAEVPVPPALRGKEVTVLCRAVDSAYSTQPERPEPLWNLRGLNCNCWHRVTVHHSDAE